MSFQISSQATSSSSGKVALFTRGKGVLKRVFRLDFDEEVCQACVCHRFCLLKPSFQAKTPKGLAERVAIGEHENEEVSTHLCTGSEDLYVTHTLTSSSLPAFRIPRKLYPNLPQSRFVPIHRWHKIKGASLLARKYVHVCFTQCRRLSLPSGTCSSH